MIVELLIFIRRSLIAAAKVHHASHRKILLLRPFSVDGTQLKTRKSLVARILPLTVRNLSLEEVIASVAYRLAPLVAVGKPNDVNPPLGAIREYLDNDAWQPFVASEIRNATRIVFVAGAATFTKWETDQIIKQGAVGKLLVVMPPNPHHAVAYFDENPDLVEALGITPEVRSDIANNRVQCIYLNQDSSVTIKNSMKTTVDYQIALQYALYES